LLVFRVVLICVVCAQTSGCAPSPAFLAKQALVEKTTPVCVDERDCAAKWHAARDWVTNDAGFPIRTASDEVIETYRGLPAQDPRLIVRVIKVPIGAGRCEIRIRAYCLYDFGCIPNPTTAALAFNRAIGQTVP